ncbi:hypothetical protein NW754_007534 [Fusarium falciforme]|nr:hypothetical protein NW754_007534 [Fusarium falciforme]
MSPVQVGFIGLGAMGLGMACNLLNKKEYLVKGYDVFPPSAAKLAAQGGHTSQTPKQAAEGSQFLIIMAANVQQVEEILFHQGDGALAGLPTGAIILICSTIPPTFYDSITTRLSEAGRPDVLLVDCPVSGGTKRAAGGTLTIFASGSPESLKRSDQLLQSMSETLCTIEGGIGAASKIKMVNQLLVGIHIAVAAEAMGLAAKAGLNTREVYKIITTAAGNSWAFENRVPHMLDGDWNPLSALDIFGIVVSTARTLQFPLPLASTAEQLYISGSGQGYGTEDDAGLVRVFLPGSPDAVKAQASQTVDREVLTPSTTPLEILTIGMIGPAVDKFAANGEEAIPAASPAEAAKGVDVLVLMVQNAQQAEDVLFGSGAAAESLPDNSIAVLCSTVPPSFARKLELRLSALGRGIRLVDAPVSGGVARAANGTLAIMASGDDAAIDNINGPLAAMTGLPENLHRLQGGVGAASSVKMINQLLAGSHIAAAAEAMAFAARLGLDTRRVFEVLGHAAAWSWMLENRVPQMLDADWTPHSALAIFVKDLWIVLDEAKRLGYFAPMSCAAHNLYLSGAAHGWAKESDAGIVRLWELTGISVASSARGEEKLEDGPPGRLPALETINALPPALSDSVIETIQSVVHTGQVPVLVVLDDDPTGTQTCHDINVLTVWDVDTLQQEFSLNPTGFFILTNSRSLPSVEARALVTEICQNVRIAAEKSQKAFEVVLRGDSTLRGHLPEEPEAAEEALGCFDGWIVAPFFFQGGRYTIDDVHYIKEDGMLVPVNQTPFAQDATFGYKNANLRQYVMEKCGGRFDESCFISITLEDIRLGGPAGVAKKLLSVETSSNRVFIVNAAAESDMHVFVAGLLDAEKRGRRYLYRTAAAFVSSRLGIKSIQPLTLKDLGVLTDTPNSPGGLIVAGSYVPKTTAQLEVLRARRGDKLTVLELDVGELITSTEAADAVVKVAAEQASAKITEGHDVLVMTSRSLIKGIDALGSLRIGSQVAKALVQFVEAIDVRPRYLIAKGASHPRMQRPRA